MSVILQEVPYFLQRVALWATARYLTRKVVERFLGPTVRDLAAANPTLQVAKPSVQFDLYQRAARAIFAIIFVARAGIYLAGDHRAEFVAESLKYGWPTPAVNHVDEVLAPAPLSARTICYDLLGWYVTDSLDLYLLKRRFNIVQWDLYFHHFTGLFLMPWFIFANRGINVLLADFTAELLVPVGFCLWWLKATGSKSKMMVVTRILGLLVLAVYRMGLWTRNITHTLFTNTWALRTNAFTDIVSLSFLALHSIGYKLDVGWIKLYLEGFRTRAPRKE